MHCFGSSTIAYEPHGSATEPRAFTQVFPNDEFWAVTTEMFVNHQGDELIPMTNVPNIFGRVVITGLEERNPFAAGLSRSPFLCSWST